MEQLMTITDVAHRAGVSVTTLRRWLKRGIGPRYRRLPSGGHRFADPDVTAWLRSMVIEPDRVKRQP